MGGSTDAIQAEYERFHAASLPLDPPELFLSFNRYFTEQQGWKAYAWLLDLAPIDLAGGIAVDIGCKYGHVTPLFFARGACAACGIDVVDDYVDTARRIVGAIYPAAHFAKSEAGYLPIAPDSVDLVLANEVISHVNPMYLPNLYCEIGRILRPGGVIVISDGNNIANAACRQDLVNLYDAWENGPAGRSTGRDVVDEPFAELRRRLIAGRHPSMPDDTLDYLARHTSGLFGDYLMQIVDRYLAGGEFIERPYRRGICPTNPLDGGAVMEFGFHPQQVELELAAYGIAARQVFPDPEVDCSTAKRALGTTFNLVRHRLRRLLGPAASRAASWGFQIVGVKQG